MPHSVFVECPNCKELMEYDAEVCPRCREEIDQQYADLSAAVVYLNTRACDMANMIKGFDPYVFIVLVVSAGAFAFDWFAMGGPAIFYLIPFTSVAPLVAVAVWFNRYALFKAGDGEFARAKRDMRGSLMLWLAILAVQCIALLWLRAR